MLISVLEWFFIYLVIECCIVVLEVLVLGVVLELRVYVLFGLCCLVFDLLC